MAGYGENVKHHQNLFLLSAQNYDGHHHHPNHHHHHQWHHHQSSTIIVHVIKVGRLEWLSGFSGSNAQVVLTMDQALLWTDGRCDDDDDDDGDDCDRPSLSFSGISSRLPTNWTASGS